MDMIQRYLALYTALMVLLALALQILGLDPSANITDETFETLFGKYLLGPLIVVMIIPVIIHMFSMAGNMMKKGNWGWLLASFFFVFGATAPYYFLVYRHQSST
jgi:hypothetical protein